jgi:hypothetical protein
VPVPPKDLPRLRKPLRKTPNSTRTQQIVAIGNERLSHADEATGLALLLAVHHAITYIDLEGTGPIEDGGLRGPSKEMLNLVEIQ